VVVLAGGHSRRFGADKLRARVEGRACLARVVGAVRPLAAEVVIATSSEVRRRQLSRIVPRTVRFVVDRPERYRPGPAGAILQGLEASPEGPVLFVPGDMPWLGTKAVRRFLRLAARSSASVAAVGWPSGETEHLFQWHRGRGRLRWKERRGPARASGFLRAAPRTLVVPVSVLTSDPRSFRHLTHRSDLKHPARRGGPGPWNRPRTIAGEPKRQYARAQAFRARGRLRLAANAFRAEADWYGLASLPILARHALADAAEAERRASPRRRGTANPRTGAGVGR
jgi:molybdopterin-guanine dinucleotide biosynthesis protein A